MIIPQLAIHKWYILPIGGLYGTYHLLREPETAIDKGGMLEPFIYPLISHLHGDGHKDVDTGINTSGVANKRGNSLKEGNSPNIQKLLVGG